MGYGVGSSSAAGYRFSCWNWVNAGAERAGEAIGS